MTKAIEAARHEITDTERFDFMVEYSAWIQNGGNVFIVRDWRQTIIGEDINPRAAVDDAITNTGWRR